MSDPDVIIVGAGPAGATAARLLAKSGASVVLIDRETFPRDKCCAGWVSALALKEFPELAEKVTGTLTPSGCLSPFPPFVECSFKGLVFHSPDLEATAAWSEAEPVGLQVKRSAFDAALVDMAREAGAQLLLGDGAVEIVESDANVTVKTGSGKSLSAKILIGADGANSFVGRSLGLMQEIGPADMIGCVNECFELGEERVTELYGPDRAIHVAIAYNFLAGYAWAFPKKSSVALGLGGKGLSGEKARVRYKEFVADAERIGLLPPSSVRARHAVPAGGVDPAGVALKAKSLATKRAILIGDAGGFVSSASGEGIYPGMLSAKIASDVAIRMLRGESCTFNDAWRPRLEKPLAMPNVNLQMMLPLIFSDKRVTAKFARAFLFGEKF